MKRTVGFLIGAAGVLALAVFFLAPSLPGERARAAEVADSGSAVTSSPRSLFLVAGVALLGIGGVMTRR